MSTQHQQAPPLVPDPCCGEADRGPPEPSWLKAARQARWLAWLSLAWMSA